jgi:hypothetical protein
MSQRQYPRVQVLLPHFSKALHTLHDIFRIMGLRLFDPLPR